MRKALLLIPLAILAAPAVAAPPPPEQIQIPPELTDPATADRLAGMAQALSKAFLDLPIGEVQAAAEGRPATAADRNITVRDLGRRDDPNIDRNVERQIANARPMIEQSMKAFSQSLPAISQALTQAADQMRQVADNLPRPQ
jgi:hypothetical protein